MIWGWEWWPIGRRQGNNRRQRVGWQSISWWAQNHKSLGWTPRWAGGGKWIFGYAEPPPPPQSTSNGLQTPFRALGSSCCGGCEHCHPGGCLSNWSRQLWSAGVGNKPVDLLREENSLNKNWSKKGTLHTDFMIVQIASSNSISSTAHGSGWSLSIKRQKYSAISIIPFFTSTNFLCSDN